jgi:DNA-binding beta-propeller fold protein YncE
MIVPVAPPHPIPIFSGFDYVTVDAQRRRVYAAHGGSHALLIVDADSGAVIANLRVGSAHGVAYDPLAGHAFVGTAEGNVVEVDPEAKKVVRSVAVGGPVDAIAYDATLGRIYADEDDGTKLWVIDARTFKLIATIALPGHKPEYLAIDPETHDVYQNIADTAEIAIVDPTSLKVRRSFKTPELTSNHPLQFDPAFGQIVAAGANGVLAVYDRGGTKLAQLDVPKGIDQCDLDPGTHVLACASNGTIALYTLTKEGPPKQLDALTGPPGIHTLAIDAKTHDVWAVWSNRDGSGDFIQRFKRTQPGPT